MLQLFFLREGKSAEGIFGKNYTLAELFCSSDFSAMATTGSTTAVADSPKVSMMVKAGLNFVIPKNKLSGTMIPVNRSSSKGAPMDAKKEEPKPPARKTKWGPDLTQDPGVKKGRALAFQTRAEQLAALLESGNLDIDNNEETRSPSPSPIYDMLGHRMNTREERRREILDLERLEAIGECMKLNSAYKPPPGFKPVMKEAKLFIPAKEHPGYNFIGLILGPRGNIQKRIETETGAKITIRGKGAVKEGKMQSDRNGKDMDGALEDLHVHIAADSFDKVDAAVALIEPLLIPLDEDRNMLKMKQLRELAEMNGTLNDLTQVCGVCGEAGHREWQCSKDKLRTFLTHVSCQICGDGGHPTIDCPLKSSAQGVTFNKEFLNILQDASTGLQGVGTSASKVDLAPADAKISQPLLLTSLGVQPLPPRWIAPAFGTESVANAATGQPDGASPVGLLPRFSNPLGPQGMFLNPPGPQGTFSNSSGSRGLFPSPLGSQGMNPFLPRFPPLGSMPLRGQPFPGPVSPMGARMPLASTGQVTFPAGRLALDSPSTGPPFVSAGMQFPPSSTPGQTQALGSASIWKSHPGSIPQVEFQRKNVSDAVSVVSSVGPILSHPSSMVAPRPGGALSIASNAPSTYLASAVRPLPTFSSSVPPAPPTSISNLASAGPVVPVASVNMAGRPPVIHPVRPTLPSVRPVPPSVGAGVSIASQNPSLAGGPGQDRIASFRTQNDAMPAGHGSLPFFPQPPPDGSTAWGQFRGPPPSPQHFTSASDKSISPSFMPQPLPFPPQQIGTPTPPSIGRSGPMPVSDPPQGQSVLRTPTPSGLLPLTGSQSFTPVVPHAPQNQFVTTPNNEIAAQPFVHSNQRPPFPPLLRPDIRSPNSMPPFGANSVHPPSSHLTATIQQNPLFQPQEVPQPSRLPNAQLPPQGIGFPRPEFPHVRHPHPVLAGAHIRAEFRSPGPSHAGLLTSPTSIMGSPGFNRPPPVQVSPREALNKGYSSNFPHPSPPNPVPILGGSPGAASVPWDASPPYRNRPDMLQVQGQPGMMVPSKSWIGDPHVRPQLSTRTTAEVDPEYEKLMASVGVL